MHCGRESWNKLWLVISKRKYVYVLRAKLMTQEWRRNKPKVAITEFLTKTAYYVDMCAFLFLNAVHVRSGDIKLVQHILDADPKQCNKLSPEGATPLMIAAMMGRGDIAGLLVQRGADINMQDSKSGWTALMQATFHR